MRLTVYEQGTLDIQPSKGPGSQGLTQEKATALIEVGQAMGARLATWDTPDRLRFHQFVGMAVVDDIQVEVLPKVDGWGDAAKAREALLKMLVVAHDLDVKPSDFAACDIKEESVLSALARIYLLKLAEAIRRGLRQEYREHEDQIPRVRGKIHWAAQLRLDLTHVPGFACRFDDRSEDTPLNRTLKAALRLAERILGQGGLGSLRLEVRHALEGVADVQISSAQLAAVHLDRMSHHLAPLFTLAKLLLGQSNPDFGEPLSPRNRTYAFVWDMNMLFEAYVAKVAKAELEPLGVGVQVQAEAGLHLGVSASTGRNVFALRPDILLYSAGVGTIVLDTKWKRLDPHAPHWDVSPADVYQVTVYAQRYMADMVVLAYPHAHGYGPPGERARFQIHRPGGIPLVVSILTLDLAELESVAGQVSGLILVKAG